MLKKGCTLGMIALVVMFFTTFIYAVDIPTLYLKQSDGKLYYENDVDMTQLMNVENMQLDTMYTQQLRIKNDTDKTYELFLKIEPSNINDEKAQAFLKAIHMEVYDQNTLLFSGSADALYKEEGISLHEMAFLGEYSPNMSRIIDIQVRFDATIHKELYREYFVASQYDAWKQKGFPLEEKPKTFTNQEDVTLASLQEGKRGITYEQGERWFDQDGNIIDYTFAQTIWKFYASHDDTIQEVKTPPTDDSTTMTYYVVAALLSLLVISILYHKRLSKR